MSSRIEDRPKLKKVTLIDEKHVEFYWDQSVVSKEEMTKCYHVLYKGKELPLYERREDDEWNVGTVYEPEKMRTTVSLTEPIPKEYVEFLEVWVENIANKEGVVSDKEIRYHVLWQPYYTKFSKSKCGITVKSSATVCDRAHSLATEIIDTMLLKIPEVAEKLVELHGELAIYPVGQDAYDIPEHRVGCLYMHRPVEGYGGVIENPLSSISEVNVLRILEGEYVTRYQEELILAHEFAHGIHLIGIEHLEDQSLAERIRKIYQNAKRTGKWPSTYAISNYEEYFATLTTVWFNVMEEAKDGIWNGVRGPVNTREELYRYDREAYELFADIYPDSTFPYPWDKTKNLYDINGQRYEYKE